MRALIETILTPFYSKGGSSMSKKNFNKQQNTVARSGCKDMWNAFMLKGATFTKHDIPICPTYLPNGLPKQLVSYTTAKAIYKRELTAGNDSFHISAFVHFCEDDQKFDGKRSSIWLFPDKAYEVLCHFDGIISPDFSTFADFPDPLKRYNTYRMRAFGYWCYTKGLAVINNVRWGTSETWDYTFDGIPQKSVIFIGTVASDLRKLINKPDFENGLYKMVEILRPHTIIVYGSSNYPFFSKIKEQGITVISFPSDTDLAYRKGDNHE